MLAKPGLLLAMDRLFTFTVAVSIGGMALTPLSMSALADLLVNYVSTNLAQVYFT